MKNCQNKQTAQRLVPSDRSRLAENTALKRDPHVRKLRKMVNLNREDWKALARKAANEQDPKKLLAIVEELNKALEERENQLRGVSRRIVTKREGGNELLFVRVSFTTRFHHLGACLTGFLGRDGSLY